MSSIFSFGVEVHGNHICYTIFGYTEDDELLSNPQKKFTADCYTELSDAVATAIDNTGKENHSYSSLKSKYSSLVPSLDSLKIKEGFGKHRKACHQGFDFKYASSSKVSNWDRHNTRWFDVGRSFLIKVTKRIFKTSDENLATFIAMTAYYTHLIGDLAEGQPSSMDDMGKISNYKNMKEEVTNQVRTYGTKLKQNGMIDEFVTQLEALNCADLKASAIDDREVQEYEVKQILDCLADFVPKILKENMPSSDLEFKIDNSSERLRFNVR